MHGSSLEIDTILATLAAAEAQVRWLMAEALSPAAAYRVEAASTARARTAEAALDVVPQRLTGNWGEFIELEPGFEEAILASLPAEPPLAVAMRAVAVGQAPPSLPADFPDDGASAWEAPNAENTPAWMAAEHAAEHSAALSETHAAWETSVEAHESGTDGTTWTAEQQAAWDAWQAQQAAEGYDDGIPAWTPAPAAHDEAIAEADATPEHGEETYADHLWRADADPWSATPPAAWGAPAAEAAPAPGLTPDADRPDTALEAALETTRAELTVELPRAADGDEPSHESTAVSFAGQDDDGPLALDDAADDPSLVSIAQAASKPNRVDSVRLRRDAPAPAPVAVGPAALTSGAPTLDDNAIQLLFVRAHDTARQSVAEAVALYGDVLDAQPEHIGARLARGRLLLDLGDYVAAASDLQRAETVAADRPDLHAALGDLFFARKDYRRAQGHYDSAVALDGSHAHALYKRGLGKYYRKEFPDAVEDLERAKKLDGSLPGLDNFLDRARRKQA